MAEVLRMICLIKPHCSPPALMIASRKLCTCCSSVIISGFISSIRAERRSSFSLSSLSPARTGAATKDIRIKRHAMLDGDFMLIITLPANGEVWNEEREAGAAFSIPHLQRLLLSATQINEIIAAIVRPRRRDIRRTFGVSNRFLKTIADRIDSICGHAEAGQKVFRSAGAAITQTYVVLR